MKRDLANSTPTSTSWTPRSWLGTWAWGNRINTILQAAFFQLTKVIPIDLAVEEMKQGNYNSYFKKAARRSWT